MSIPSYQVKVNQTVGFLKDKSLKIPYIEKSVSNKDVILPVWLERKAIIGKLISEPTNDEIIKQVNLRLIIEYYSR